MGPGGLNGRVRDGNGCFPSGKATGQKEARLNKGDDGLKSLDRLVLVHYNPCRSYMPSLSTWSSSRGLQTACAVGDLVLRWVSHLDAFSGSPVPT